MFHRVKSEVRDSEQKNQEESEKIYNSADNKINNASSREDNIDHPIEKEDKQPRNYSYRQLKTQEEKTTMMTKEEASVPGKYARDNKSERETEGSRPGYTPSVARSNYGGSSYGSSSYTAPEAPVYAPSSNDRTLTIGRGINLSGEIDACDHLLVEGTVEAALKGSKILDVAESGTFYGTVEIEEATIAGRFEGDITVNGRLTVKSSGVITGSIAYRELEVEAGAMVDGRMTPLKGNVDPKAIDQYRAGTEASAMAKAKPAKKAAKRDAANAETGLFTKAHASY